MVVGEEKEEDGVRIIRLFRDVCACAGLCVFGCECECEGEFV